MVNTLFLRNVDAAAYLNEFGGTALGLAFVDELCSRLTGVQTPKHTSIPVSLLFAGDTTTASSLIADFIGREVICKVSGLDEAFSEACLRGANSSLLRQKLRLVEPTGLRDIWAVVGEHSVGSARAIVLQEFHSQAGVVGVLAHVGNAGLTAEFLFDGFRFLVSSAKRGSALWEESTRPDRSISPLREYGDLNHFLDLLWTIHEEVGFSVNTEGFWLNDGGYLILQLRPIPDDAPVDSMVTEVLAALDPSSYSDIAETRFTWGTFDVEGIVRFQEEVDVNDPAPVIVLKPVANIDWEENPVARRIGRGLPTVLVDTHDGFSLCHSPDMLPPPGPVRQNYKYISAVWTTDALIAGQRVRLLSDGTTGMVCRYDDAAKDRKRTIVIKGRPVTFSYLDPNFNPPFDKVTSVAVIAFATGDELVAAILSRGIDLPGGHVKEGERTIEEVARREAKEEAGVELGAIEVAQVIQSDYYGTSQEKLTYMVVTTAKVTRFLEFHPTPEVAERVIVTIRDFVSRYSAGNRQDMERLILRAQSVLRGQKD